MKKYLYILSLLLITSLFFASPSNALATSGPLGLNSLRSEAGPGVGQVTLNWTRYYQNVDNYSIAYGTSSGNYQYGVANIGNNVVYTIGALNPGQRYYFFVYPSSQGNPLPPVSPEISEIAATSTHTVMGTAGPYGPRALTAVSGPASGQVTLTWLTVLPTTSNFALLYGTQPGVYIYGALNVGNGMGVGSTNSFTVGALNPGTRYYFSVVPLQGGGQGTYSSAEVSQVAR